MLLPVLLAFLAGASPAHAWTWPASGPVLQRFSYEGDPYAAGQHRGVDVGGSAGESVLAPAAGSVTFAGTVPGGGRTVTIRTPDGFAVTLLHLGAIVAVKGASVAEGARVGTLGSSGTSELAEPYVHLGIRQAADAGGYLDPESFLPPRISAAETGADVEADPEPTPSESTAAEQAEPASDQRSSEAQAPAPEPEGGQSPSGGHPLATTAHVPAAGDAASTSTAISPSSAVRLPERERPGVRTPTGMPTAQRSIRSPGRGTSGSSSRRATATRSAERLGLAAAAGRSEPATDAARAPQVRGSHATAAVMAAL
ncbi:MAG TPA: peptidoglycan DD-metalloendopeptidase family protein, partial [Gaiellaceae bacterium]|nr:peptidoglycan DD-metalloendopeptidase family protein [Gaiellaceae bacterium]